MSTAAASYTWIDLEMTGLDSHSDRLLEVAMIVTDERFAELSSYHAYVKNDVAELQPRFAQNAFWQAYPKNMNHFLQQATSGQTLTEIDTVLVSLIDQYREADTPMILAGNSVHADRRFIERWLPETFSCLHYRQLDVSSWKVVMESRYGLHYQKANTHRALDDIKESMTELQYYLDRFDQQVVVTDVSRQ